METELMESWANLIVGRGKRGIRTLSLVRDMLEKSLPDFDRMAFNRVVRKAMTKKAEIKDANFYAYDKCQVKGHLDAIADGYQSLWDNGVDTPVQCMRCGRIEI